MRDAKLQYASAGATIAVFATVLMVFFTQNMVLTVLPVSIESRGMATGLVLGLLLAATEGLGMLIAPPLAAWADRRGYRAVLRIGGAVTALSMMALAFASMTQSIWLWAVPVLMYAFARTFTMAATLAVVTGLPKTLRAHGINSTTQRIAAMLAAAATSVAVIWQAWSAAFWLLALSGAAVLLLARYLPRDVVPSAAEIVAPLSSYRVSANMLARERSLQASSLIGVINRVLLVTGNAFFALSVGIDETRLAGWILLFLVTRDLTSAVCGPAFRPLIERFGLRGASILMGICSVGGLLVIGAFDTSVPSVVAGAVLQGIGVFIAIGTTNLLATHGRTEGRALRLTSTFYVSSVVALIFPALLGMVLDRWGGGSVFIMSAAIVAVFTSVVVVMTGAHGVTQMRGGGIA